MRELMKRSEAVERAAWLNLYHRAPVDLRRDLGLEAVEHGDLVLLSASELPHLLLNRAIGLGGSESGTPEQVSLAVEHYARRGITHYWVHLGSELRYSELPALLKRHGIAPYPRSWMKFARLAAPVEAIECELEIRPASPQHARAIGAIVASGFDLPPEAGSLLTSAMGAPGWRYFVALDGHTVVSAAAIYIEGEDACLVFAGTAPSARRRGCQRALMAARLGHAQQLGCRQTFTETGMPIADKPGSSYRNILRAGFDELYVRDNFAPEGTSWQSLSSSDEIASSDACAKPSRESRRGAARSGT